jgi:benzoyl-CoA 2,3-dioxygenase component A
MEQGVTEAFRDICRERGMDWQAMLPSLREAGRYHLETY